MQIEKQAKTMTIVQKNVGTENTDRVCDKKNNRLMHEDEIHIKNFISKRCTRKEPNV